MTEELLDDKIENGNLTLPFSLSYVKGPFKGWKYTFFLSLILSALAGLVLYYMEYIFFRNNNPMDWSQDYFEQIQTQEYRDFQSTYSTLQLTGTLLFIIAGLSLLTNFIFHLVVLYRHWSVIQKVNNPSATPGTAVGFLFIPFFNIYWMFIAFYKLSVDQKRFIQQYGVNVRQQPMAGLALASVICRLIPYLGNVTMLILGPMRIFNQQKVSEDIVKQYGNG